MNLDTTLNLAWLLLGITALASTIRAVLRQPATRSATKCLHVIGVALIMAALFPFISATDDIVRIEQFTSQHNQPNHPGRQNQNDDLIRLYETMDSPLVCRTCVIVVTVAFAWMVLLPSFQQTVRSVPMLAGRDPPAPAFA